MMRNEDDRRFAQTLARGIQVLQAFKSTDGPLGNQELSARTGIPKPTISRLTFTLSQLGFLEHLQSFEKYRLGPAAIALGNVANATIPFIESASELMQPLANEIGALVALTMRDGDRMLLTHCWRPANSASIWLNVGFRLPMARTATGLAWLGTIERSQREEMIDFLGAGETDPAVLRAGIDEIRDQLQGLGFATSIGRWNSSINSVAVPFRSPAFAEPLVFLAGAPADMTSEDTIMKTFGPRLVERVRQLDMSSGGGF